MSRFRGTLAYKILLWLIFFLCLVVLASWSADVFVSPEALQGDDFVQYWSAGRLNVLRANPYDPEQLRPLQHLAGRTEYIEGVATIAWNPPWALALLMPFGVLPYPLSRLLWLLLHLALVFIAAHQIWHFYGGVERQQWVAWGLAFMLVPTLFALKVGQIGPLLLVGLVGALIAARGERWMVMGVCLALLTIKPQLPYLFWPALLLWSVTQKKISIVLGGIVGVTFLTVIALAANPTVIQQYYTAVTTYPPVHWATPTLGGVLRLVFGVEHFWLQFVPPLAGCVWLVFYWYQRRCQWDWGRESPLLLTVSLVTAAYAWSYDLVLLILPAVQMGALASRRERSWQKRLAAAYVALNVLIFLQQQLVYNNLWFMWVAPAFLLWYLWRMRGSYVQN